MLLVASVLDGSALQNWTELLPLAPEPRVASAQGSLFPVLPDPVHTFVSASANLFEFPNSCVPSEAVSGKT